MKKTCALLSMIALAFLTLANKFVTLGKPTVLKDKVISKNENIIFRELLIPKPEIEMEIYNTINDLEITYTYTYTELEYEYIGTYYITAYCPSECGWNGDPDSLIGWYTASGEVCHRANESQRLYEPTTCAIDRDLHSFGELFYVEGFDRVFVAEDTGSAVKGRHIDLFYEDYEDVISFPTGYYDVYSVEYVTKTSEQKNRCCLWKYLGYNKSGCVDVATIQR